MNKIAIIVGHTFYNQGAKAYNGVSEYEWNLKVAQRLNNLLKANRFISEVYYRNLTTLKNLAEDIKKGLNPDVSIELHFNSYTQKAHGCEALVHAICKGQDFDKCVELADILTNSIHTEYGIKERGSVIKKDGTIADGVYIVDEGLRGTYNLEVMHDSGISVSVLVEPTFANFPTEEATKIIEDSDKYAGVLARGVTTFFRGRNG